MMLLFGLEILLAIGATHIESVGDSLLVVHQIYLDFMCIDESLHIYVDKCLNIIYILNYLVLFIYLDMILKGK